MQGVQKLSSRRTFGLGQAVFPWKKTAPTSPPTRPVPNLVAANLKRRTGTQAVHAADTEAKKSHEAWDLGSGNREDAAGWEIKLLYDGDCPVCMAEVKLLKSRDKDHKIAFVDISADDYDPDENEGVTFEEAMGSIHAILPTGEIITGIDTFRRLYAVVGLGWVFAFTNFAPLGRLARCAYGTWAQSRLKLTGRDDLATILQEKKGCDEECEAPW